MRGNVQNGFYVYEHWRPDTGACFYVGKGVKRRAWDFVKRNEHHKRITSKLRGVVDVVIISDNLTERDAFALETARIAYWRGAGCVLANKTDGGEGAAGHKMSDAAKARISSAHKGKTLTPEHRAKLSEGQRRRYSDPEERLRAGERSKGRKASPETIAKRAAKLRGRKMSEAACKALGDRMRGKIVSEHTRAKLRAANIGRKHSERSKKLSRANSPFKKAVRCLNTGAVFQSASEAARLLGVNKSHVAEICRGSSFRKSTRGLKFEYVCGGYEGGK